MHVGLTFKTVCLLYIDYSMVCFFIVSCFETIELVLCVDDIG